VDMVNVTKFLGDTSLNNFRSLCDIMILSNTANGANLQLPLDTQDTKRHSASAHSRNSRDRCNTLTSSLIH